MTDKKSKSDAKTSDAQVAEEARATDVLDEFSERRSIGDRLTRRVGARRFERARVVSSASSAIFDRCHVADPFDPDAKARPIGLGPVGIEERRKVAPHAAPPRRRERKAKSPAESFNPKGIPNASTSRSGRSKKPVDPLRANRPPPNTSTVRKKEIPQAGRDRLPPTSREEAEALIARSRAGQVSQAGEVDDSSTVSSAPKRARPTTANAPVIKEVTHTEVAAPKPQASPSPSPVRRPAKPMDLDDLFGGAAHVQTDAERPKRVRPTVPNQSKDDE